MGLYDRDYIQSDSRQQRYGLPQMRFNLPRMTPVVKWLLIVNVAVFALSLVPSVGTFIERWFALNPSSWSMTLQPWRPITYQFLHSRYYVWHIFFNMFGLFMLGPSLERFWGSRRFLSFYLICGVSGGLLYLFLVRVGFLVALPMVGASGAVLGVIAACAILFPHFMVIVFIFPVPIRIFAVVFAVASFLAVVTRGQNAGGDVAHFAGMAVGAGYVLLHPKWDRVKLKMRTASWEKKIEEGRRLQIEVDRILAKVHHEGLHSLTAREKKILKRATQEEIKRHQL
jgi:membrane associated rhomboid family serine protease